MLDIHGNAYTWRLAAYSRCGRSWLRVNCCDFFRFAIVCARWRYCSAVQSPRFRVGWVLGWLAALDLASAPFFLRASHAVIVIVFLFGPGQHGVLRANQKPRHSVVRPWLVTSSPAAGMRWQVPGTDTQYHCSAAWTGEDMLFNHHLLGRAHLVRD